MFEQAIRLGMAAVLVTGQLMASVWVSPRAHAQPAATSGVVIHRLQVGGALPYTTDHEYIEIYNNSDEDIDATGWCLIYNNNLRNPTACLKAPDPTMAIYLTARSSALFMHPTLETHIRRSEPDFRADKLFTDLAASIAATNGSLRLVDKAGATVDLLGWGTGQAETAAARGNIARGKILQRKSLDVGKLQDTGNNFTDFELVAISGLPVGGGLYEQPIVTDACPNTPEFDDAVPEGYMQDENGACHPDVCRNLPGLQKTVPTGHRADGEDCVVLPLKITELLPNAAGLDTGNEFIELFNPNDAPVELGNYYLRLNDNPRRHTLPNLTLPPLLRHAFSDTELRLTLPNSSGWLSLFALDGTLLDRTDVYSNPAENTAWAMIDGVWQYTNRPTPGQANLPAIVAPEPENSDELAPCPPGQERNPLTNRCRKIAVEAALAPCPAGYERNPETNRCRRIRVEASPALAPCPAGYERNPETNRCRRIRVETPSALAPCPPGQERNPATGRCRNIATTTRQLAPCPPGQERNPATGRCRQIAAAVRELAPCPPGQERNPETNRCRRIRTAEPNVASATAFANTTPSELHNGLLVSVALMGLAYGGWEYRLDLMNWLARLRSKNKT